MRRFNDYFSAGEGAWPLLEIRYHHTPSQPEFDAYLEYLSEVLSRQKRFAVCITTEPEVKLPPTMRRQQAQWLTDSAEALEEHCAGFAFCLESMIQRGVLTAIMWAQPLPCPQKIAKSPTEARQWCREQLRT